MHLFTRVQFFVLFTILSFVGLNQAKAQRTFANAQSSRTSGLLCVGCSVTNPTRASDADTTNFSRLNGSITLLQYVEQTLIFPSVNANMGCDSVVVRVQLPPDLINLSLLDIIGSINVRTANGSTENNDGVNVNQSLIRLLDDSRSFNVVLRPQKNFDRVTVRLGGVLNLLSALNVFYAYSNKVDLEAIPSAQTVIVCKGSSANLSATANTPGASVVWFTQATGGNAVFTGNNFNPTPLVNTIYYAETQLGTCVSDTRTPVQVNVVDLPLAPVLADANVSVCQNTEAVLSVSSPQTGIQYNWYASATGGTILSTGTNFTTPPLNSLTEYYVEAVNATGCTSATRTKATVTVDATPVNPVLAANSTSVAAGQSATIAVTNAQTGTLYNWYTSPTALVPVFVGTTYQTPALLASATYYVQAVGAAGCLSLARTPITIQVNINTNSPCSFANIQSSDVNGLCIGCSVTNNVLAVDADSTTASTIRVTAGLLGGYAEQELRFQQAGIAGDTVKLVLETPVGLADVNLLGGIRLTYYNGSTAGQGYTLDNALIKLRVLPGSNRYAVLIPATGAYDRIRVRLSSGVAGLLTSLQVFYATQEYQKPVFSNANTEICSNSAAKLSITAPTIGTFAWFTAPTGGTAVFTGADFTTPNLTANTTYYVEYSRNGCVSPVRYPVQVLVVPQPVKPVLAFDNATICSGETIALNATALANTTIKWYDVSTGGTALFTGESFVTPALTANKTYYAEASVGSCVSADRSAVVITVNATPQNVAATPTTQAINAGQTATFSATSSTVNTTFSWFATSTGGTSLATGASFTTPPVFANTTYYLDAVSATGCQLANRIPVSVTVNPVANADVPCDAATNQTTDINGLVCLLCTVSNPVAAVDANANSFSQLNVGVGLLNAYAQQTLLFPNIGRAGDSVVLELGAPGALADVGVLSQIQLATYSGNTYNGDRFNVNGSLLKLRLIDGQSRFRIVFPVTKDFDRVEVRFRSAVAGVLSALRIYYAATEVAAPVITAQTVNTCVGSQATLTATAPDYVTVKWYTSPTGGTAVFTGKTFNTPALSANTTYYAEATRTGTSCPQSVRTKVDVIVNPLPVAPVIANNEVTICAGETATFSATPIPNATIKWYASASGGTALFTGNNFTTPVLTATTNYYAEAQINGQCTSASRTMVTANVAQSVENATVNQTQVTTCNGSSATLTASSTQPGVTFSWYETAGGATPVFEGAQFTTPSLTQNRSYYVEAASGSCVSPDRVKVDVTVNPAPAAPTITVTPESAQITSGQSAVLSATSSTSEATIRWYADAEGGTPLFEGAVFTTPNLSGTTTYYAEAFVAGTGCVSTERTAVTVTVNPIFSTSCDFASSQTNSVNGLCLLCSVQNGNNAIDTDTTNFTRINVPVGLVGGNASQQLIFKEAGSVGDTVSVLLRFPVGIADIGLLSQVQVASFNGANFNNDRTSIGNLITVRLLPGGRSALVRFAPAATFDRVEVRLNSGVAALLSSVDVFYASKQVEQPKLSAANVEVCAGGTATFAVTNARAGIVYEWFDAPTAGNLVFTGTTFTTPALTSTTTFYVQSRRLTNNCPNPNRVAAQAVVNPVPPVAVVAQNAFSICPGERVSLSVTNAGTSTVKWYDAVSSGTLVFTGTTFQTPALVASANYYAEISTATCTSASRTLVTITVKDAPAKPTPVLAGVQVCSGNAAVLAVANPETGVSYDWFTSATGGTAVFTGINFTTPAITQNTSYYVQARNTAGNCINTGGRTQVNVTVTNQLDAPVLSATNSQVCSGGSVSLSVNNPQTGVIYKWYTSATGTTPVFTGTTFTTPALTASTTYYVEAANGSGCASARTQSTVNVIPVPDAPKVEVDGGSLSVCQGSQATISIANPQANQVYNWYVSATGGTSVFTGIRFTTPNLSATTTYYVEASSAGNCNASARTAVTIRVNQLPNTPVPSANAVTVCLGSTATLSISSPQTGVTYRWYGTADRSNKLFEGSTYVTGPISADKNFYVDAVNTSGCASTDLVTVQVKVAPAPATPLLVNNAVIACSGSTTTLSVASPQSGFTYNWYASATSTDVLFTGTTFTTPQITANASYYVSAVNASKCSSATRAKADVTVSPAPVAPTVSANGTATICTGKTATFTATSTNTNVSFKWYNAATGGTALFTGSTFTTSALTSTTTYYVEAVNNASGCASATRSTARVIVQPGTTAVQPQIDQSGLNVCEGSSAKLSVSNPQIGTTYNWYTVATGGTAIFTGATFTTPVLTASTTYYVEASSTQACAPSARTRAAVIVSATPQTPVPTNAIVNVCTGNAATLSVASPVSGVTYRWYDSAIKSNLLFEGDTYVTEPISANKNFYLEAVSSGGCANANLATLQVKVASAPGAPLLASNTASVCPNDRAVLSIANPESGITYNWYASINGTSPVFTGTSFTTPQITANTSYYVEAVRGTSCASASRTTALVTLKTAPAAPVIVGNEAPVCAGLTVTLKASSSETGVTFKWYASATSSTVLFTGEQFTTPALTANTTYYVETASTSGSCVSSSRTPVPVAVTQKLQAPVIRILNTTSSTVVFGWNAVSGATGYEISTNNGQTFTAPSTGAAGLSHTVTGLQAGQQVAIIVRAKGASDCQTSANSVAVTGSAKNPEGNKVFIPNAFTPNGDGNNDVLLVFGPDIKSLTFRIYNQWGQLYFTSMQQSLGWDGTYKGVKQPVGVYVYYLDAVLNNGEAIKMKGTITLLR